MVVRFLMIILWSIACALRLSLASVRGARLALVQLWRAASCWALITASLAAQSDLCAQNLRACRRGWIGTAISLIVRIVSLSAFLSRAEMSADEKWSHSRLLVKGHCVSHARNFSVLAENDINFPSGKK